MEAKKKTKNYLFALFVIVLFVILGSYLKKTQNNVLEAMEVVVTAKVPKDDVFQFFYWERTEPKFQIKKSIRTVVKGISDYQEIHFKLPKVVDLIRLRLDIGENANQGTVSIKQIKFIKGDEELIFDAKEFGKLFSPNAYIVKKGNSEYDGKAKTINSRFIYDPYFVSIEGSEMMEKIRINRLTHFPYLISAFVCLVLFLFLIYSIGEVSISGQGLFIGVFFVLLLLPSIQNEIQFVKPLENLEKRKLAPKPEFSLSQKFARDYEDYYNDNFGLRNHLINWGGIYRTQLFQSSMHPELVMFGKDKWLFYNKMSNRMYRSYSRQSLSREKIAEIVDKWSNNKERYEAAGRDYFLAFWPNKHSIYPEHLPTMMKMQIRDTFARADQVIQQINKRKVPLKLTDVRKTLMDNKGELPLYHKFDSHWNDYGAFLAYQDFFWQNRGLGMIPKTKDEFDIDWKDSSWGELIQMLGVRNRGYFIEKNPRFTLKEHKDRIKYLPIDGFPKLTVITKNEHSGNKLRALIFRDSYTNSLIQFFSLHFYEVYYIWGHNEEYVERLQPDIIIDGFVERQMGETLQ